MQPIRLKGEGGVFARFPSHCYSVMVTEAHDFLNRKELIPQSFLQILKSRGFGITNFTGSRILSHPKWGMCAYLHILFLPGNVSARARKPWGDIGTSLVALRGLVEAGR